MNELEENAVDKRVKLYKAISGIIPGGSFIAELGIDRIPNQRLDRVIDFIEKLKIRLGAIESKSFMSDERFGYLAENSILEAAKSYSSKRRSWLASICTPLKDSPSQEEWDLRISSIAKLAELSDNEVEYLIGYTNASRRFRLEHAQEDAHVFISMADRGKLPSQDLFEKILLNNEKAIHRNSLLRLNFIELNDDGSFKTYVLTDTGKLFLFLLTGEIVR